MKTFYEAIYEWVAESFGQSEAEDPSWNIEALADHLSKTDIKPDELNTNTQWFAFDKLKERSLDEDIKQLAKDKELTLTKDEVSRIKDKYYKIDDETWEQLSEIMDNVVMERGE